MSEEIHYSKGDSIFSTELKEDKKLKLTVKKFYEDLGIKISEEEMNRDDGSIGVEYIINTSLEESASLLERNIENSVQKKQQMLEELRNSKPYPNNYVFASLAERSYNEKKNVLKNTQNKENLHGKKIHGQWILLTGAYHNIPHTILGNVKSFLVDTALYKITQGFVGNPNGYFGAAYWNPHARQIILVHRGTESPAQFGTDSIDCILDADFKGVISNEHVAQIDSAITFIDKIVAVIKKVNKAKSLNIQLFITGHSLGAWLAPITAFSVKYLENVGGHFLASKNFEKTGYDASTVIFDGPGCRRMLDRIQNKLMNRSNSSLIDSLDITNYLSAPNIINACNPQVGNIFRIYPDISEEDEQYLHQLDFTHLKYTFSVMHKINRIITVFDSETGEVLKDQNGNLKIKRVLDWPLLLQEKVSDTFFDMIVNGFVAQLIFMYFPVVGIVTNVLKVLAGLAIKFGVISKALKWQYAANKELNDFFKLANIKNEFHVEDDNEDAYINIGDNSYRTVRYKTQSLDRNYCNRRNLNAFTQPERLFLERYKLLQRYQDAPSGFKLPELFNAFDEDITVRTMDLLERCELNANGTVCSENLSEFIPYLKRMLYFFPKIKDELENAYANSDDNDILRGIYQLASSSFLDSIQDIWVVSNDIFGLNTFLNDNDMNCLHIIQSVTALGILNIYKILDALDSHYLRQTNCAFLNLDRIFYLGDTLLNVFLKRVKHKYLLVIQCDQVLSETNDILSAKIRGFFWDLFINLNSNKNIKIILISEKNSKLSLFISNFTRNAPNALHEEKTINVRFNDLTLDSQNRILEEKTVIFQGKEMPLGAVINRDSDDDLEEIIDPETITDLARNYKIEIGKPLPSLGETENYYIDRKLFKKVMVKEEVFRDENLKDCFAISNIKKDELLKIVKEVKIRSFTEEDPDRSNPIRFITLPDKEECFTKLCEDYSDSDIHWLMYSDSHFLWKKSHAKSLSGLHRHIENYEMDLPEAEYKADNASIKMFDEHDLSQFEERFIVVAAEPGMGKTTALTRLGTQNVDYSKWFIRMNLIDYKENLEKAMFENQDSVISFMHENSLVSNTLAKMILKSRLEKSGKIIFLLDGFDEITSAGQKNVISLLLALQNSKVENVLITTRLHLRNELENVLSTVAYAFKPFFYKDQIEFLRKFWKKDLVSAIDESHLDNYIEELLKFISYSIGDKERRFMGIPMQLRMIAEAFHEVTRNRSFIDHPELSFPKNFDMLQLYERFINAKYRTYSRKIGVNVEFNDAQRFLFTKELNKIHKHLAISVLSPETMNNFVGKKIPSEDEEKEINLVGIVQVINRKVKFTHRTFAEYFFMLSLVDGLNKEKLNPKYKCTFHFLNRELFENKCNLLRTLLDFCLAKEKILAAALKGKLNAIRHILRDDNSQINQVDILGRSALHYASQEGYSEIVDLLLKSGAHASNSDDLGKTALHYAARYNRGTEVINCLLMTSTKNINFKDNNERTAVYYAAQQGDWDIVERILNEKGASVDDLDKEKLLFHYTYNVCDRFEIVKNIVAEEKMDIKSLKDNHGNSLLHIAALRGHLSIVHFFLENGCDVNFSNNSGKRPIAYAAQYMHWDIVVALLRNGSVLNELSKKEKSTLIKHSSNNEQWDIVTLFLQDDGKEYFCTFLSNLQITEILCSLIRVKHSDLKNMETIRFLAQKQASVNTSDKNGKKPIHYAAENGHWNIAEILLKNGAGLEDLRDQEKLLLLNYSAQTLNWEIVRLLVKSDYKNDYLDFLGDKQIEFIRYSIFVRDFDLTVYLTRGLLGKQNILDINTPLDWGRTLLHIASEYGNLQSVQFFIGEGACLNAVDDYGSTPLHLAARKDHFEVVQFLLEKNSDANIRDKEGKTSLHYSAEYGFSEIVRYLILNGANVFLKDKNGNESADLALKKNHIKPFVYINAEKGRVFYEDIKYMEALESYELAFDAENTYDVLRNEVSYSLKIQTAIAEILKKLGRYDAALKKYEVILERANFILGPAHFDTLFTQTNIAEVLLFQGKYHDSDKNFTAVIDEAGKVLEPEDKILLLPVTFRSFKGLADVLLREGKYFDALMRYTDILDSMKKVYSASHLAILRIQNSIADALLKLGKYMDAFFAYDEVLCERIEKLGSAHPDTLNTQEGIGKVVAKLGRFKDALTIHESIWSARNSVLGPQHPDTLSSRNSIAENFMSEGKFNQSLELFQEVLLLREKILGPAHPDTLITRCFIAKTLVLLGKYTDALEMQEATYHKQNAVLGAVHPDTLASVNNIGRVFCYQGSYNNALAIFKMSFYAKKIFMCFNHPYDSSCQHCKSALSKEQDDSVLQLMKDTFGISKDSKKINNIENSDFCLDHPEILDTEQNIAWAFERLGMYDEAREIYEEVLKKLISVLGPYHPNTLICQTHRAFLEIQAGKYDKAEAILPHLNFWMVFNLGRNHPQTLCVQHSIALLLHKQGKADEAYKWYADLLKIMNETFGDFHSTFVNFLNDYASFLHARGESDIAFDILEGVFKVRKEVLGLDHPDVLLTGHNIALILLAKGKQDDAKEIFQEVLDKGKNKLSSRHPVINQAKIEQIKIILNKKDRTERCLMQ